MIAEVKNISVEQNMFFCIPLLRNMVYLLKLNTMETENIIYYPVPKDVQNKWDEILEWFKSNYDTSIWRLKTKQEKNLSQLYVKTKYTKNKSGDIQLTYRESNKVVIISQGQGADELVKFIRNVGVKKVYELKIKTSGGMLVNNSIDDIREKNPKIIDSYYIVTKTSNMEKFAQMQTIIDGTGFKAKVKYIENI